MKKLFLLILTVLLSTSILAKVSGEMMEVHITKPALKSFENIIYTQNLNMMGISKSLGMNILKPYSDQKLPLVVYITGGGFFMDPKDNYTQQRVALAEAGYVVASIEYTTVVEGTFPQPLIDAKAAIRYLKAHADFFGIDKNKVAVMGDSAGGYLSAFVGTTNGNREFDKGDNLDQTSDVQFAIDLYGLSDLTKVAEGFSEEVQKLHESASTTEALLVNGISFINATGGIKSDLKAAAKANPINYITKNTPSFLIMHGEKDILVSPKQTEILNEALLKNGIDSKRVIVKDAGHADIYWYQPEIMEFLIKSLNEKFKK